MADLRVPRQDLVMNRSDYQLELVQSAEGFLVLQEEWEWLRETIGRPVIFQSWIWNWVWWKHLAPAGSRLAIVTCRNGTGDLVGLAPLYLHTYRLLGLPYFRQLRFIGTDPYVLTSEYLDILVHPACAQQEVLFQLALAVRQLIPWDSLWFSLLRPDSMVSRFLAPALSLYRFPSSASHSFRIDTRSDWEKYLSQRGRKTRKNIRSKTKKILLGQRACFRQLTGTTDQEMALQALVSFHGTRWISKGALGAFAIPGFGSFLRELVIECGRRWQLRVWVLSHEEKMSAVLVAFLEKGNAYAFQMGFDAHYEKDSLGFVLLGLCIRACFEDQDIDSLDLLSGGDAFKRLWTKEEEAQLTFLENQSGWRAVLFSGVERVRGAGKNLLRTYLPVPLIIWGKTRLLQWKKMARTG
jgi:CelD/BcsL family acetyltransferase involved in cellulose biosynthesis